MLGPTKLINLSPQIMKGNPAGMYYDYARNLVNHTKPDSSVLLLATEGMPQNEYYINYYADGRGISLTCAYEIPDFKDESYVEKITNTMKGMDYAFVIDTSEEMNQALVELTGGELLEPNRIYQVKQEGDQIKLLYVTE